MIIFSVEPGMNIFIPPSKVGVQTSRTKGLGRVTLLSQSGTARPVPIGRERSGAEPCEMRPWVGGALESHNGIERTNKHEKEKQPLGRK
jgi:hypothetical protein